MSRRHARHEQHEEHENHERWLISYADFITLLLVFFIIMFAISSVNISKFRALAVALSDATGSGTTQSKVIDVHNPNTNVDSSTGKKKPQTKSSTSAAEKEKQKIAKQLKKDIAKAGLQKDVKVIVDERGVVLLLTNSLLFTSGAAQVLPHGSTVLTKLIKPISSQHKPIVVEGHTDNSPISTAQFPSNWELSTSRATNVLRFLLNRGIDPKALAASGYADTHPMPGAEKNATAQQRAMNRRVELILVVKPDSAQPAIAARTAGAGTSSN